MARVSWFKKLYWQYLSKPASDRALVMHVLERPIGSVLEIGMGTGNRTKVLLSLLQRPVDATQLRYSGVDPFESSEEGRKHLKLKEAHRLLSEAGVKAHLFPGDASTSLQRVSHTIQPSELVIIDGGYDLDSDSGKALQHWLPRLVTENGTVFACAKPGDALVPVAVKRETLGLRRAA